MFIRTLNRISIFLILLVVSNKSYSQSDTCFFGNLPEYRIVNEDLSHFLDSIIPVISYMDKYAVFNTEILVILFIKDTNQLIISVTPNSCTQFNNATLSRNDEFTGYLHKKKHLVIVAMPDYKLAKLFVEKTGKNKEVLFINSDNLVYHLKSSAYFDYYFSINNGLTNIEDGNYTEDGGDTFIYKIKAGDTWEILAKKFHCLEADLKWNFNLEREKLIKGNFIGFDFYIDDNKKVYIKKFL